MAALSCPPDFLGQKSLYCIGVGLGIRDAKVIWGLVVFLRSISLIEFLLLALSKLVFTISHPVCRPHSNCMLREGSKT